MSRNPQGEPRTAVLASHVEESAGCGRRRVDGDCPVHPPNQRCRADHEPWPCAAYRLAIGPVGGLREALTEALADIEMWRAAGSHTVYRHVGDRDDCETGPCGLYTPRIRALRAALRAIESPAHPETGLREAIRDELDRLLVDAHGVPDEERAEWADRLAAVARRRGSRP